MWEEGVRIYDTPGVPNNFPSTKHFLNNLSNKSKWCHNFCAKIKSSRKVKTKNDKRNMENAIEYP